MKSAFRTTAATLLFFFSFHATNAQKIATALQFNDYMVTITDTLYLYGTEWGDQFNVAFKSKDFASLASARTKLEEFTGKKFNNSTWPLSKRFRFISFRKNKARKSNGKKFLEVTTMKDIGGSENLRAAMLEFIAFEKQFTSEYFVTMEKFDSKSTDDEIQKGA